MQKLRIACAVLGSAAVLSGTVALACGDHLLVIGRGVRFQRAYGARPANVVIYASGNRNGDMLKSPRLQAALKQAGHKLQMAGSPAQLLEELKAGKVDVVLTDFADLAGIIGQVQSAPSNPVVLPVLVKPSKTELAAAQKEYKFALKASSDEVQYLAAIDEAMKLRLKTGSKT